VRVIPARLNELSPDAVRSLFPGFVDQLGVLVASPAVSFEFALRNRLGYPWALSLFETLVMVSLIVIFAPGPEKRGKSFYEPKYKQGGSGQIPSSPLRAPSVQESLRSDG
jgi:SHS family lactate transporter-like MFS transporter